jgi:hypothetical protein
VFSCEAFTRIWKKVQSGGEFSTPSTGAEKMGDFDYRSIANAIQSQKGKLLPQLHEAVRKCLISLEPAEALTLRLTRGDETIKSLRPAATAEYAGALISFCRERQHEGYTVDSNVTPRVVAVVEEVLLSFYMSEAVGAAVTNAVLKEIRESDSVSGIVQREMVDNQEWLGRELKTLATIDTASSIAAQLTDATAQQIHHFLHSAVGKQMMAVIGKIMATSTGKTLIVKGVQAAVAKVMASAALKAALLTTIKKVGIGILIKTVIGKAILALLALVGIAHVPLVWIILPILAAFLVYEYNTFPEKLAQRVPGEVVRVIETKFGELNESIAKRIVGSLFGELVRELTKVRPATGS